MIPLPSPLIIALLVAAGIGAVLAGFIDFNVDFNSSGDPLLFFIGAAAVFGFLVLVRPGLARQAKQAFRV